LQLDLTAYRVLTDLNSWQWHEPEQLVTNFFRLSALMGLKS